MRLVLGLLTLICLAVSPTVHAQPVPPERPPPIEEVVARLVADGLLSDSLVAQVHARSSEFQLTRSSLLLLASIHAATQARGEAGGGWGVGRLPSTADSLAEAFFPAPGPTLAVVDRLRAAGAITERTRGTITRRLAAIDAALQPARDSLGAAMARGERVAFMNPLALFGLTRPDVQALSLAMTLTEREEQLAPERWRPLLDSLAQTGHLGYDDRDRVLGALRTGDASTLGGVLARLPRVRVVRPERLPVDLEDAARAVTDTLTAWLGRTGVADLHVAALTVDVETRPGWNATSTYWTLVLTADADGRRYAADAFGSTFARRGREDGAPTAADVTQAAVALVNKVLRDRRLPHRLATAQPEPGALDDPDDAAITLSPDAAEPPRPLVVAAVTAREAALYRGSGRQEGLLSLGFPGSGPRGDGSADVRFTTDRVAASVALLDRLGLVSDSARVAGERRLARAYVTAPVQIVEALGLTWSTRDLDVVTETASPFGALTLVLARISRGAFAPTDVEETFDGGHVAFAFSLGDRRFTADLQAWESGFDGGFLPLVNRALGEAGIDGQFLDLEQETDESATYLFVTAAQRQALVEAGLLDASACP